MNHANEGDFRLVGGNRIAFVSLLVVKRYRLLPPSHHVGTMDVRMRAIVPTWSLGGHVAGTTALPLGADIRAAKSAFWPGGPLYLGQPTPLGEVCQDRV